MARYPDATWRGSPNVGGTPQRPAAGLVVHVEVGTETGTNACFQNPTFQASAHFGCANDGSIDQWVDTDQVAWAEVAGNPGWVSVETEGTPDSPLTGAQVTSVGRLFAWLRSTYPNIPAQTCDHDGTGLTTHAHYPSGQPDQAWGGHPCPGTLRSAQLPAILAASGQTPPGGDVPAPTDVVDELHGPNGSVWQLKASGEVDTITGTVFYGSYLSLPDDDRKGARYFVRILARPDGKSGYRLVANDGARYDLPV